MKKINRFIPVFMVIAILFAGCDAATRESKIEDAKIALDNNDFNKAVSLLGEVLDKNGDGVYKSEEDPLTANDLEAAQLLASAEFGLAGINLTEMLNLAASAQASKPVLDSPQKIASSVWKMTNEWLIPAAFAGTSSCITNADFRIISEMLPPPLTQNHLSALIRGLSLLEKVINIEGLSASHPSDLKYANLQKLIGYFSRIVMDIILATDSNGNNVPDNFSGVTVELATITINSFKEALGALAESGILGTSEISKAIKKLKNDISLDDNNPAVSRTNLEIFLRSIAPVGCS
jgi:hypothetical protein